VFANVHPAQVRIAMVVERVQLVGSAEIFMLSHFGASMGQPVGRPPGPDAQLAL
jgi:hypothetical protein